jgi:flagellar hook-length control protein FliK
MFMPPVQAAASAPLPVVAAPENGAPEAGALFDAVLGASLASAQPIAATSGQARAFTDAPALLEWLLLGVPEEMAVGRPAEDAAIASDDEPEDEPDLAAAASTDAAAACVMPIEVAAVIVPPPPQSPPVVADAADDQADARRAVSLVETPAPAMTTAPAQDAPAQAKAQDAPAPVNEAAEPPATVQQLPEPKITAHQAAAAAAAPVIAESTAAAAEVAAAASKGEAPTAPTTDAMTTSTGEPTAATDGDQPAVAGERPAPVRRAADAKATAAAPAADSAQAITRSVTDVETPAADVQAPPRQSDTRENAASLSRGALVAPAATVAAREMSGGDTQSFGQEPRQSPAAQRFAAALAAAAPAAGEATPASAAAPVITVPVAAHAAAPVHVAAAAAAAPAAPAAPVDVENVNRLIETMRVTAKAGGWEATVRLRPEHLGEVTIALRVEGKTVSAVVQAESAGVRQWLQSQEEAVRSGLSEHGLDLGRYQVDRDGQRREAEDPQQHQQPRRRAPRREAQSQRFEIVV